MFGAKRSGIPVPGTAAKSNIPLVKKTNGKTNTPSSSSSRNAPEASRTNIPSPTGKANLSPARANGSNIQAVKPSNKELPNDPKVLKAQIIDLQTKLDSKEETLSDLNHKLTRKTEECAYLVDEMDTVRRRSSVDLQQVTKDYVELQEMFQEEQRRISEMEKNYREERECLQLELDMLKGEHEMELQMLRKELIDVRNKSEQRGIPLDPERSGLVANYERKIQALKEELHLQTQKVRETTEKLEQKEFEMLEKVNEVSKQYEQKHAFLVAEHKSEMTKLKESNLRQSVSDVEDKMALESLEKEHEAYIEAMKEQFDMDLQQIKTELDKANQKIELKETEAADDLMSMRNEYETQLESLRAELKAKEELIEGTESRNNVVVEQLKNEHTQGIKDSQEAHRREIERIQKESREGNEDISKGNLETEPQQKRQLEAYEHEIRNLKAELKKERLDFTEARELLEGNITDMENEMKEREEKTRKELHEQHQYEIEVLKDEHEKVLHDKQKIHKQEMAETRKQHEQLLQSKENEISSLGNKEIHVLQVQQQYEKTIEELKLKHELELENLQETLESLQIEHEELQTEYDLVVNDLASELETTKLKAKGSRRTNSGALKEHIGKLKNFNDETVQHLTEELKTSKGIISSLNEEISNLRSQKQNAEEYMRKVTELENMVSDVESNKDNFKALEKDLEQHKVLVKKLQSDAKEMETEANRKILDMQQRVEVIQKENEGLQTNLARLEKEKQAENVAADKKISNLQKQADRMREENEELKKEQEEESQRFENESDTFRNEMQQELNLQKLNYEEMIAKLKNTIDELESERQTIDEEQQRLREELKISHKSEPLIIANESFSISSENIDMIGDEDLENTEGFKYDQSMKGIVEEFENKIKELQMQLAKANQDLTAKNNRLQSVGAEMNVLRENLENERNVVQNLEERGQKLMEKHDSEIKQLRQKLLNGNEESRNDIAAREKEVKQEYQGLIENLTKDKDNLLDTNKGLNEEINELKKQLKNLEQQLVEQEAKRVAEEIKQNEIKNEMMKSMEDDVTEKNEEIASLTSVLESERSEHASKVKDLEYLVEQLSSNEDKVKDLVSEVQKQQNQNASLRSELAAERQGMEEKIAEFEREQKKKCAEIDSLASLVDAERRAHEQRIEQLEKELKKKVSELNALGSMLEKEQTSHEKTIKDTQKHFAKLSEVENKNYSLEEEARKLKTKLRKMKAELSKREQENEELLQRNKQMAIDELQEVQNLNRSLTEAEIHKGKLLREVENSKDELQKTQERYSKTKDKLKTMKEKWQKDHSKLEEILLSPRVEMGLQASLIEPEELEDTRNQLSDSMRANTRLMEELKDSKEDLDGFKNDMHALKRANNVLIKQNQVLYLETEGYKNTVENLTLKTDQLREVSIKLTKDIETLELENKELNKRLEKTEFDLSKAEGEKSSIDALNESSRSELEERRIKCCKLEEENVRMKNQNDFLLSQGKRLQERVEELENEIKQLKHDLLIKEVDIIKKERLVSEIKSEKVDSRISSSSAAQGLEQLPINESRTQKTPNGLELQGEKKPLENQRHDLVSHIQSLKDSVGSNSEGDMGYVGIKSYQVIEWDTNKRCDESRSKEVSRDLTTTSEPLDGLHLAKIKQLEFDSSNYLGSAYWDTMNFLKKMKSTN